jgi:AbiJ N-terminal domain 4
MSRHFSNRHGYGAADAEITVREDAPDDLRYAVAEIARSAGMKPSGIRTIACRVLLVTPDRNNWSEYPNIWEETLRLLSDCAWFKVYDIAEAAWRSLEHDDENRGLFGDELNRFFREKGIGWELKAPDGIVFRGGETFVAATNEATQVLEAAGLATAANEIHEALRDISRRPIPDRTGAIQHAIAALECTAREVAGEPNATLGSLIPKLNLPKPLDLATEKLWGFASDRARHVREGKSVSDDEAELIVSVSCAVSAFLTRRVARP